MSAQQESIVPQLVELLDSTRGVKVQIDNHEPHSVKAIGAVAAVLRKSSHPREADALEQVVTIARNTPDYGGMGLGTEATTGVSDNDRSELVFLASAWLESLNSADRASRTLRPTAGPPPAGRRPMNVTEKIFAFHDVESKGWVRPGEMIRVSVDWIMSSEQSWHGMVQVYNRLGDPGIFRNDRLWLAGDHIVEPRNMHTPLSQDLMAKVAKARRDFKMTEYQGYNYTIMHTEFFRERTQPGMLIIGSDSHTCSSGANGCLSIGMGAADVTMALVTGETWFKVPEVVEIRFVGKPPRGVGGKDVILYVLQQLKRNTVAADRVVEYTGPGLEYLSPDARFAVANMTTEFGGITGIFAPDHITENFINQRKLARHKDNSFYFRADAGCEYVETHTIDLTHAEPFIARYPSPDDVVSISEMNGKELDGCFIGACTTAEEDIIMGALVLQAGLKAGKKPVSKGLRKVVPGSRPILDKLRKSGLADAYEQAGFEIGVPGCSYCVGMSTDVAGDGEVWLSSQNRNFKNRMGPGSIGNLASAATVAASSFDMKMTSPLELISKISEDEWNRVKGKGSLSSGPRGAEPQWVEPAEPEGHSSTVEPPSAGDNTSGTAEAASKTIATAASTDDDTNASQEEAASTLKSISATIYRLGDFIDTDALAPAQFLVTAKDDKEFGTHCLEYTNPDFRQRVADGSTVVVAGKAFGCGSSRMEAVQALLGVGVECVIAKSFAFIYSRNQPSLGLLGITITDEAFYEAAQDGAGIDVDLVANVARVGGKEFAFELSQMEKSLTSLGGVAPAFNKFGKKIFDALTSGSRGVTKSLKQSHGGSAGAAGSLNW
ncbi:3-isopropylmalate dehydratase large subunit 2 [Microdochium trichocladiopsis]|uniref:3-isopropylmalate dehydratase large subunit 2 n=1 Tax=Microdochium trichocladiopsis TaxID=1682393 RepID=A0A9P8Y281_9PEZI|nr:3-isopropylmalate dehydratase large subunit 2 [Microdochium trichocladiopsis]KAH7025837.1 3-isopropylmalate dehydratase large subunit 2 [Microdochium trichocladiopsis]